MDMTRRTTLAMLGLIPATAVGAETFLEPIEGPYTIQAGSDASPERVAGALERLAASIRSGETLVSGLQVDCSIEPDTVVEHKVSVRFCYQAEFNVTAGKVMGRENTRK